MSADQVYLGFALTIALAVAGQIVGLRLRVPSLIILLPLGFAAGAATSVVNPNRLLGASFQPLVSISVAIILYDAGFGLDMSKMTGHTRTVVVRLLAVGIPLTFLATYLLAGPLFGVSDSAALMLAAILVVSGPTVVGPLLNFVRPRDRLRHVLGWEGSLIDPVGALLGAVVFHGIIAHENNGLGDQILQFILSLAVGGAGAVVGVGVLWLLLCRLRLTEQLATTAQLATVVVVAGVCNVIQDDTGLMAAIGMGVALGNIKAFEMPSRRPFFEVTVKLIIGLLFISISATVTPASVRHLLLPVLALVAVLVLAVRPVVAALSTLGTGLGRGERAFVGWMAPRGIVAAATASTFAAELVRRGVGGADRILAVTFLVIVMTVTWYGLTAAPVARRLGVVRATVSRPLLVGGEPWVVDLGRALRRAGLEVLMWAEQPAQRSRIDAAGLDLADDDLMGDVSAEGIERAGVTTILLLTEEDNFNALAATLFQGATDHVYRTASSDDASGTAAVYAGGDVLFGVDLTQVDLENRYLNGSRIVTVRSGDGVPPDHDLLFRIRTSGELVPSVIGAPPEERAGDTEVLLGPALVRGRSL
ncbi:MAG TPA: cation:proton antiporter [Micromonosporaceae bacterium]